MFLTKKHLPRRTFLQSVGATIALPLLDSMIPANTALAQTAAKPMLRAGFVYIPMGAHMADWTPLGDQPGFKYSRILKPLEPFRDRVTVVEWNLPAGREWSHPQLLSLVEWRQARAWYRNPQRHHHRSDHREEDRPEDTTFPSLKEMATEDHASELGSSRRRL